MSERDTLEEMTKVLLDANVHGFGAYVISPDGSVNRVSPDDFFERPANPPLSPSHSPERK